ncbi:MnmG, N-terminal domain [Dillenia turbinata]|uniref:MnmG, N-terminal domain n=1 Tax=Dillenia turbinata TaxID=194707 RepID=A0AAN8ZPL0_9MAGN
MAEDKKKPLSLNERHNHLLQGLSAFHGTEAVEGENRRNTTTVYEDDLPRFSGIADFDSPLPDEENPSRLRRKVDQENSVVGDIRGFKLRHFESPPEIKIARESDHGCGNKIRDILSDLSWRLELLSIEKNRISKPEKNDDLPEYAIAGSSFSLKPDASDSSSNAATQSKVGDKYDTMANSYTKHENVQSEAKGKICGFLAGLFYSHLIKRAMAVAPKTLLSHRAKELMAVRLSNRIRKFKQRNELPIQHGNDKSTKDRKKKIGSGLSSPNLSIREIWVGRTSLPAGRAGKSASFGLTENLQQLGFETDQLKTGIPARVDCHTIDFSALEPQHRDEEVLGVNRYLMMLLVQIVRFQDRVLPDFLWN